MNYRISRLDNVISQIDGLISELCTFNHYFVEGMEIVPIEANNLCYRLCKLLQVISELSVINEIDCDDLKFKWINETNVDIQSFQDSLEQMISNISFVLGVYTEKQLSDFVIYNEKYLSGQLKGLKNVLLKRKCYILCGKAPIPQNKVQNRINKANLFNRIFNRNQKV